MKKNAFYEKTHKRLKKYGVFSEETLEFVARNMQQQTEFATYQAFFKAVGAPLQPTLFMNDRGQGVPLVDIDAREKQQGVLVAYLPMGNSLDPNQLYQVATLAHAFPNYRVIAFGNPSGKQYAYREQNLSVKDWFQVAFTKSRRAAVSAELDYLHSQGIKHAYHVGYSFGALKALLAGQYAPTDSIRKLILVDPVAHSRGLVQLVGDFKRTFTPLGDYVNRTELQTFFEARKVAAKQAEHSNALFRPVNIAIALMLARADFISLLQEVLQRNTSLETAVAWGNKSELGNDAHMKASLHRLAYETASGRVRPIRLEGDTHAFANDLALYTAIVHDALMASQDSRIRQKAASPKR